MKHKTWFRLVLKAIGVLLIAFAIPAIFYDITMVIRYGIDGATGIVDWSWILANGGAGLLRLAIGLYLVIGGEWIVNRCIPSNRPYCPDCGYDVSRCESRTCPECGTSLVAAPTKEPSEPVQTLPPIRRVGRGASVRFARDIEVTPLATDTQTQRPTAPMSVTDFRLDAMKIRA